MPKAGCISGPRSNRLRAILSSFVAVAPVVCLGAVCLDVVCFGQSAHRVTAVRFWSTGDITRVAEAFAAGYQCAAEFHLAKPDKV